MATEPTVALHERVEYVSKEWLGEAERFLKQRAATLPAMRLSFAVQLTSPPPHLHDGRKPFGYSVRIEAGDVHIGNSLDPAADVQLCADYNADLVVSSATHAGDGAAQRRLEREYRLLVGDRHPILANHWPRDTSAAALLAEFQDHMARRTINNPDVRHRATHLGLQSHLEDLDDKGYTVLEGAFSADFADELRAEAHRNHDSALPDTGFRATMLLRRGRIWEEAAIHPWVLTLAEYLLGRGCLIYQSDTIVKGAGLDTHPGLHADYGASRVAEPFPEYCLEATAVWAIDDFDLPAGPTVIVPGSFRNRRQVPAGATREEAIPLELAKGSIAFWHGATWHGAMPRQTAGRRTSLHNAYSRFFMRPLERYDDIDCGIVDRNPPAFATLCGLDDPFGKSGDTGADFERMRYAASAGYGSIAPVA